MERQFDSESVKSRIPLFRDEWIELYKRTGEHPHAPTWNTECGDRLTVNDTDFIRRFAHELENREEESSLTIPQWLIQWTESKRETTPWFREKCPGESLKDSWQNIQPMRRSDMQSSLASIVPDNEDFSRLIVNPTSGTTGHPIPAPNHPRAVGCYDPLIQYALKRHGLTAEYSSNTVAALQICSQKKTITYHTVHSYLHGAGFAKINLTSENWKTTDSAEKYISDMKPVFLSGDPFSFMEYMRLGITYRPGAVLTTALALTASLRRKMEEYFACPVVDMYSLNETGPIAYSCPADPARFHILPHDIFVEILAPDGRAVPEGEPGEIAVSGGRNPYLPLLRYITGDSASIIHGPCRCGEKTPSLHGLQGREMVLFTTPSGAVVNSIDIAAVMREYPVYFFQFTQKRNFQGILSISAGNDLTLKGETKLKLRLESLFNSEIEIFIDRGLKTGDRKNIPFISEIS